MDAAPCHESGVKRFPPPWTVEQIPGGYKVLDASGQALAYVYGRETKADADIANVLTMDEARRMASNIAKLPALLGADNEGSLRDLQTLCSWAAIRSWSPPAHAQGTKTS